MVSVVIWALSVLDQSFGKCIAFFRKRRHFIYWYPVLKCSRLKLIGLRGSWVGSELWNCYASVWSFKDPNGRSCSVDVDKDICIHCLTQNVILGNHGHLKYIAAIKFSRQIPGPQNEQFLNHFCALRSDHRQSITSFGGPLLDASIFLKFQWSNWSKRPLKLARSAFGW